VIRSRFLDEAQSATIGRAFFQPLDVPGHLGQIGVGPRVFVAGCLFKMNVRLIIVWTDTEAVSIQQA